MRRLELAFLIFVGGVGCSDSPPGMTGTMPPPGPITITSGTRLRARWEIAAGVRRLAGWYDRQLNLDCAFDRYNMDGEHRCIPHLALGAYFADAACTQPAAGDDPFAPAGQRDPTPRVVVVYPGTPCTPPSYYEVGAVIDGPAYEHYDGQCTTASIQPAHLYRIGAPISREMFATATEKASTNQLWLESVDGARAPWGGWDGTRAVRPASTMGGGLRWVPFKSAGLSQLYADASCTMGAAVVWDNDRCPVDAVVSADEYSDRLTGIWKLGPPLQTAYGLGTGSCAPTAPPATAFALGDPIPFSALAAVAETLEGSGAVALRHATLDGQPVLNIDRNGEIAPDVFVDVASGSDCSPQLAADGVLRCLPATGPFQLPESYAEVTEVTE